MKPGSQVDEIPKTPYVIKNDKLSYYQLEIVCTELRDMNTKL